MCQLFSHSFSKCLSNVKLVQLESMVYVLFVKHDELMQMRLEHTWHWALLANLKAFTNYTFTSSEKKLIFKTDINCLELLMSQFSFMDFEVCSAETTANFRSMVKEFFYKNNCRLFHMATTVSFETTRRRKMLKTTQWGK